MEKGEEKLAKYVNANYILKVIEEHHKILKDMNNTGKPMRDKVYDNVINLSSEGEEKPLSYAKVIPDVS
jgi:ADP-heptose:LPS heptosyltransferase